MAEFKFLHASDIHLDSPLRGLSRYEGMPGDRIRLATRDALTNLVAAAIEENVSFVIIAGDLYDGDWDDFGTGLFFCAAMRRLGDAGIAVYLLYGNHDADSVLTKKLPLPANVHVFGHRRAQSFHHDPSGTTLHGRSYRDRDPGENLAATYPSPVAGRFNIGVLHTALTGGRPPHAPYSPCSPADLAAKDYDYWALGHVHNFEVVSREPYIVFPGNIQGRNIRETGPKGAALVSVEDGRVSNLKLIELDAVRWAAIRVDVSQVKTEYDLRAAIRASIQDTATQNDRKPLIARVTLIGQIADNALPVQSETLREDIRAIAVGMSDDLWIEKVRVAATGQATDVEKAVQSGDIAGLFESGLSDPALRLAIATDFADFASHIPPDLGDESSSLLSIREGQFDQILTDAAAALRSRLLKQET